MRHHAPIMIVERAMMLMLGGEKESGRMTSRCFDMLAVLFTVCFWQPSLCSHACSRGPCLVAVHEAADTMCSDKSSKAASANS